MMKGRSRRALLKWMALESIQDYKYTAETDVWSFGVLLFELITLGAAPYGCINPEDMEKYLKAGNRLEKPQDCPDHYYELMLRCWQEDPSKRPTFGELKELLIALLEEETEDYYIKVIENEETEEEQAFQVID